MSALVLYGSQYGSAASYAHWIAEDLGGTALALEEVSPQQVRTATTVVIGASDYAGSLTAAAEARRLAPLLEEKSLAYFTVSFGGDMVLGKEKLDALLAKNFGPAYREGAPTAHFRGAMDYSVLSRAHRTAMVGVRTFLKTKPHRSVTDQQMLDCYGAAADYRDRNAVEPFVQAVRALSVPAAPQPEQSAR